MEIRRRPQNGNMAEWHKMEFLNNYFVSLFLATSENLWFTIGTKNRLWRE